MVNKDQNCKIAEKNFRFLDFGAISFAYRKRKKEEIFARTKLIALGILIFSKM